MKKVIGISIVFFLVCVFVVSDSIVPMAPEGGIYESAFEEAIHNDRLEYPRYYFKILIDPQSEWVSVAIDFDRDLFITANEIRTYKSHWSDDAVGWWDENTEFVFFWDAVSERYILGVISGPSDKWAFHVDRVGGLE
jgi:hypothetical protein